MLVLLSPAKTLDYETPLPTRKHSTPQLSAHTLELVGTLQDYSAQRLAKLMRVSGKIAQLNHERYQSFAASFTAANARPALLAFKGDVYQGIDTEHYGPDDFDFAQRHVRILSGLYGVLRPLDRMQPYRLEMGTKLKTERGKDLYAFWGRLITDVISKELKRTREPTVVNLASQEYFKAVDTERLEGELLNISFKEKRGSSYKVLGLFAKRARGLMTDFMIRERITEPAGLKQFRRGRYRYNAALSEEREWVFTR